MNALILDPGLVDEMIEQRREWGVDKFDEVWEGVYVMTPAPNNEHQELATALASIIWDLVTTQNLGRAFQGVNVTDREDDWTKNYRCPDVAVFLNDTKAKNCNTHWLGGPDFAVEIISQYDKTRDKLPFYEKVGTRELLLIDRDPWQLELYQLQDNRLILTSTSTLEQGTILSSAVVPLTFRLSPGQQRPTIEVATADRNKHWLI